MLTNRTDHERLFAFVQGFALLLQSGVSLVRCLTTLQMDAADATWREGIRFVCEQIERGEMLSKVMSQRPDLFPRMLIGMVRAGEVGGVLDKTLQRYADYMRQELELFRARSLDEVSRERTPCRSSTRELALWCYKFGIMLNSGVPILQVMEVSVELPTSDTLREAVLILRAGVREGQSLAQKMAEFPDVFPEVARQLFAVGEATGTLDDIALRLSDYLEKLDLLPGEPVPPAAPPTPPAPPQPPPPDSIGALVNSILQDAIQQGASDVHLQPTPDYLRVRYRVDGALRTVSKVAWGSEKTALVSRFKIMAGMSVAERSVPQRGRMGLRTKDEEYNLRVRTYPFADGEGVRVRILPQQFPFTSLINLGMTDEQAELCKRLLHQPCGIIAVAGVYGSGRTTTLYTILKELHNGGTLASCSAVTLEDPVEMQSEGVNQVSLNRVMGLTYAEGIRSVMRQDPDIIMVSEVSDAETMAEVVHAAATGHLLLIGVTAPDAVSALENLLRLESEAAGQMLGVIAQRLLRKVCADCKGTGCDACKGIGYRGRTAGFEVLSTDSTEMQKLLHARAPRTEILACALRSGMMTLAQAAARKVEEGATTEEEVKRVVG